MVSLVLGTTIVNLFTSIAVFIKKLHFRTQLVIGIWASMFVHFPTHMFEKEGLRHYTKSV